MMDRLSEAGQRYAPENIVWDIGERSEDEGRIIEENRVGYISTWKRRGSQRKTRDIDNIPDGEYPLLHWAYVYSVIKNAGIKGSEAADQWKSESKVRVEDGAVDIQSVKVAVAEVLNKCGERLVGGLGRHLIVERLSLQKGGKAVVAFLAD